MNVAFASDYQGYPGLEVAIYSLLTWTKNVNIYILSMNYTRRQDNGDIQEFIAITPEQQDTLQSIVEYLDPKRSTITFIDTADIYNKYFLHGCAEDDGHSSPYAALRLAFDVIFPHTSDILYLDADIVIQEDLTPMYNHYLAEIKASKYCYAGYTNYLDPGRGELVGGVLLFDLNKAKENNFFPRARYNITHKFYIWYDQSAMQDTELYVELQSKYNYMKKYECRVFEPAILHFTDQLDPKVYLSPNTFYKKFPHLKYIEKGLEMVQRIRASQQG